MADQNAFNLIPLSQLRTSAVTPSAQSHHHLEMNNSTVEPPSSGLLDSKNIGGFGYGIGVSVGILLLITTITLASYFCTRNQMPSDQPQQSSAQPSNQHTVVTIEEGVDEATLLSYPKLLYSQAKLRNKDTTASCCSICLADYKNTDVLRLLPGCSHLFHLKCVDPWLRLHPTCPVCRTSPIPTPLSTPLAEVVPLAGSRR